MCLLVLRVFILAILKERGGEMVVVETVGQNIPRDISSSPIFLKAFLNSLYDRSTRYHM